MLSKTLFTTQFTTENPAFGQVTTQPLTFIKVNRYFHCLEDLIMLGIIN